MKRDLRLLLAGPTKKISIRIIMTTKLSLHTKKELSRINWWVVPHGYGDFMEWKFKIGLPRDCPGCKNQVSRPSEGTVNGGAVSNTPFTRRKNYLNRDLDSNLDCDPEVVPVYTGHSLFNTTKRITLLLIVQTLLHRNQNNIEITFI